VYSEPLNFSGIEQHPAPNTNRLEFSGALQPMQRRFADLQNCQNLGARKQARAGDFPRGARSDQVLPPLPKRAERWRDSKKVGELSKLVGEHCRVLLRGKPNNVPEP